MSQDEWQQYFGTAEYHKTCPDLPLHSSFTQPLIAEGRKLAEEGDINGANAQFKEALKLEPALNLNPIDEANHYAAKGLVEQGKTLARNGDVESAIDKFEEALKLDPLLGIKPDLAAQIENAHGLVANGLYSQAMSTLDTIQKIDPTLNITLTLFAYEWDEICQGESFAGIEHEILPACDRAVMLSPQNCVAIGGRGQARALTDDPEGAIEDLAQYVTCAEEDDYWELDINQKASWLEILRSGNNILPAKVLLESGRIREALAIYHDIEALRPRIQISALDLDDLCWQGTQYGFANYVMDTCEKAVELAPDNVGIRDSRGYARGVTGNIQGAIEDFEFVVKEANKQGWGSDFIIERKGWLAQLHESENPFE